MLPLLHIEFQENYRDSTGREGGPTVGLPVVFNTFLFASREFTWPVLRDHLVERLLCDYLGYCLIIIAFCIISNSHNH